MTRRDDVKKYERSRKIKFKIICSFIYNTNQYICIIDKQKGKKRGDCDYHDIMAF